MLINNRFSRFYHGAILKDLFNKSRELLFRELMDTRTGGAFVIKKYEDYNSLEELKQLLKILNVSYGVDIEKDCKISTKHIETKELLNHIEWVFDLASKNQIELNIVREEWERMIEMYNR